MRSGHAKCGVLTYCSSLYLERVTTMSTIRSCVPHFKLLHNFDHEHRRLTGVILSAQPTSAKPSQRGRPFSSWRTISSLSPSRAVSCATTSGSGVPPTSTSMSEEVVRSGDLGFGASLFGATSAFAGGGGVAVFGWDLEEDGLGLAAAQVAAARPSLTDVACTFCAAEAGGEVGGAGRTDRCLHSFSKIPFTAEWTRSRRGLGNEELWATHLQGRCVL